MAIAVETLLRLIDDELGRVADPERRRRLQNLLCAPVLRSLAWDYGFLGERHEVWIVGRRDAGDLLLGYSDFGFGPDFPWGCVVAAEDGVGMDAQWHSGLEDAAISGRLLDAPQTYVVPGPR